MSEAGWCLDFFLSLSLSCFLGDFDFRMDVELAPVTAVAGGAEKEWARALALGVAEALPAPGGRFPLKTVAPAAAW